MMIFLKNFIYKAYRYVKELEIPFSFLTIEKTVYLID